MEIKVQYVRDLERNVYQQMYNLNYRADGLMRAELVAARRPRCGWEYKNYRVVYMMDEDVVAGWCLFMPSQFPQLVRPLFISGIPQKVHMSEKVVSMYFWTRAKYRKQGIGSKLGAYASMLCAQEELGACKVHPHDHKSRKMMIRIANAGYELQE